MMNKKILMSVAAAATIATTFIGCGSDNTAATTTATTNSSGFTTLTSGTVVGASKGALSGAAVSQSGTTVTATGGTDVITNATFSGSVKTDTEVTDSEGRVIANTFTTLAVDSGEDNVSTALNTIAANLGFTNAAAVTKVFQATAADAAMENISRLLQAQVEAAATTGIPSSSIFGAIENAASLGAAMSALNAISGADVPTAVLADMISKKDLNPTAFALALAEFNDANETAQATFDFNTSIGTNAVTYPGFILDSNTSDTSDITSGVATISKVNDSNLSITSYDDIDETAEVLISIRNLDTTGANANASYALRMSKLTPVTNVTDYLTTFTSNANSSLVVTANSNMSKGMTLTDGNLTQVLAGITEANSTTGMSFNLSGLVSYISTLVGTDSDTATNGNFTSGMDDSGTFGVKILVNVDDNNFTTSDQAWLIGKDAINIGKDVDTAAVGTQYAGYKVLDGNLTK